MKIFFLTGIATALMIAAAAQVKLPPPSPTQYIQQEFGLGRISITYSRPIAKTRKIFGDLVPYDQLWRTGANAATLLNFSQPADFNGRRIDSGTYALYTIPGLESWEIILNKGTKNIGTTGYKESEDVLRFKIYSIKTRSKTESFTIQLANVKAESCELQLLWEKKMVIIPITVNLKDKLRAQLEAAMQTPQKPYWQAAQFYYEYDKNLNKALENAVKAAQENPKAYWIYLYLAKIQQEMGDAAGALQSSRTSMTLSMEAKNDDFVKMNERFQKELKLK